MREREGKRKGRGKKRETERREMERKGERDAIVNQFLRFILFNSRLLLFPFSIVIICILFIINSFI